MLQAITVDSKQGIITAQRCETPEWSESFGALSFASEAFPDFDLLENQELDTPWDAIPTDAEALHVTDGCMVGFLRCKLAIAFKSTKYKLAQGIRSNW